MLCVGGVFADTIMRLHKLDSHIHDKHDHDRNSDLTTSTLGKCMCAYVVELEAGGGGHL